MSGQAESTIGDAPLAPPAVQFPAFAASWYVWGRSGVVRGRPVSRTIFGKRLVAWRKRDGKLVILSAQCSHFGADLGLGEVVGDRLRCPFHHWQYAADGTCEHIPAQREIPSGARQMRWPAVERHGLIFVFNGSQPRFPLPFFPDCNPLAFAPARAFSTVLACPWFLIGANAFDLQHFRAAHDRTLVGTPLVSSPGPYARRAIGTFEVAGGGWRDMVTRLFAGQQVTMTTTDWCGNLVFVTAEFRRTTSFGMVAIEPLSPSRTLVQVFVFLPKSGNVAARVLVDPVRRQLRRYFIKKFLSEDAARLQGAQYNPAGLIDCDRHLIDYFRWLAQASHPDDCQASCSETERDVSPTRHPHFQASNQRV